MKKKKAIVIFSNFGKFFFAFKAPYLNFLKQKGTKAPQAGGKIHTDFEKGFIMAEVQ